MSDARRKAEEALENLGPDLPSLYRCVSALRALLAEPAVETENDTVRGWRLRALDAEMALRMILSRTDKYREIANRSGGEILRAAEPVPATAPDAVREAAEEWAAAEAEYDATPAHSGDTDAFERNLFRRQAARRRLLAALAAAESERDRLREEKDEAPKGRPA